MQTFLVGGAVRDRLLGLPVRDRDWVVVGATPAEMTTAGFVPVGRDFPVFLHPVTREEHALARTERKTGAGYRGFAVDTAPHVTLEDDLARRDLTINAIAERPDGTLVDPYGGQRDLQARVLRHVSPAFVEDPVRLLRVARFAARFGDFSLAPETAALLRAMVAGGEVDALVPERVWQEIARGLAEPHPARLLNVLRDCGALPRLLPEVDDGPALAAALDACVRRGAGAAVRFAVLFGRGDTAAARIEAACARLRVPSDWHELALAAARGHATVAAGRAATADERLVWIERCDLLRRPQRLDDLLLAAAARLDGAGPSDDAEAVVAADAPLRRALAAAQGVDAAAVARDAAAQGSRGPAVGAAVRAARLAAVGHDMTAHGEADDARVGTGDAVSAANATDAADAAASAG